MELHHWGSKWANALPVSCPPFRNLLSLFFKGDQPFLRQFFAVLLQNKIDDALRIDLTFGGIPVSKPENFLPPLYEIKIDLAPLAVAVCLVLDFSFILACGSHRLPSSGAPNFPPPSDRPGNDRCRNGPCKCQYYSTDLCASDRSRPGNRLRSPHRCV